jgi:hypothetical protein
MVNFLAIFFAFKYLINLRFKQYESSDPDTCIETIIH